jgi:hypothetical protein
MPAMRFALLGSGNYTSVKSRDIRHQRFPPRPDCQEEVTSHGSKLLRRHEL